MKFVVRLLLSVAILLIFAGVMSLVVVGIADPDSSDLQTISRDTLR